MFGGSILKKDTLGKLTIQAGKNHSGEARQPELDHRIPPGVVKVSYFFHSPCNPRAAYNTLPLILNCTNNKALGNILDLGIHLAAQDYINKWDRNS